LGGAFWDFERGEEGERGAEERMSEPPILSCSFRGLRERKERKNRKKKLEE
jgi:hypothetical protein